MSDTRTLSLVVATRGRAEPFVTLFTSLERQTYQDFEVIVVDQNVDDRVGDLGRRSFPITHLRTPTEMGVSRARNSGLAHANGAIILFPDDDCWYPPHFLAHAIGQMQAFGADVLTGRASDEAGRDINGRFEATMTHISRANIFTTGIEWVMFFKRAVLDAVGGYDTDLGVGAATPWQACECQDIVLRALTQGFICIFDPSVYGHHAELDITDPAMLNKGRGYGRGLGYVLRRHDYSAATAANWVLRPMVRAALSLLRGNITLFAYYRNVALGRLEGWRATTRTTSAAKTPLANRSATARG